jgi:putative transposase
MKNRLLLENYNLLSQFEQGIGKSVKYHNDRRYHESLDNSTPTDLYFG